MTAIKRLSRTGSVVKPAPGIRDVAQGFVNERVPTISQIGSASDDDAGLARVGESLGRAAEVFRAGDHDVLMYATNAADEFVKAASTEDAGPPRAGMPAEARRR